MAEGWGAAKEAGTGGSGPTSAGTGSAPPTLGMYTIQYTKFQTRNMYHCTLIMHTWCKSAPQWGNFDLKYRVSQVIYKTKSAINELFQEFSWCFFWVFLSNCKKQKTTSQYAQSCTGTLWSRHFQLIFIGKWKTTTHITIGKCMTIQFTTWFWQHT